MKLWVIALTIAWCALSSFPAFGAQAAFNNDTALQGLNRVAVYFDVNTGDSKKLLKRMDLIDRTLGQLRQTGIEVNAVIGFRADASRYVTKGSHYILDEDLQFKQAIQQWVKKFAADKVAVEQCSIAANMQGIEFEDFMPEVEIVENGYVSMIGYQSKGYAQIPMD